MSQARKAVYVLGTGLSHDGSSCLLKDGRVAVAIEKERVTRRKHDGYNDTESIRYCLDAEGLTVGDLSLVVQNENFGMFRGGNRWYGGPRVDFGEVPIVTISHHLAHAYSAFHASPFDEAATLIIDGCGSSLTDAMDPGDPLHPFEMPSEELCHLYHEKDSYYRFDEAGCRAVYKDFSPWGHGMQGLPGYPQTTLHSIGGVYLGVSTYVFAGFEDPGKLMGLAPYGRPGAVDFEMFELRDGRAFVRYDWMKSLDRPARTHEDFKAGFQYYADLAHCAQREIERAILYVANARYELAPSDNLAYSGGVALNAVANRRLLRETKFKNLFIQPAAGDNGLALGCAYYGWSAVLKRERVRPTGSSCFGRAYPEARISAALDACGASLSHAPTDDYVARAAELLASGRTVGWFQGGAEFGPRALGHRSILADPKVPAMRDHLNAGIKGREDFRPFAPSVRLEDAPLYFDCEGESPYMLLVAPVRTEWQDRLPSVVHEDKSARLQTVTQASDPTYYALLTAFKERTGTSVLLNTSFNRRGMPIVETPEEALSFFTSSALDVLVLGRYLVTKQDGARAIVAPARAWAAPSRSPPEAGGAPATPDFIEVCEGVLDRAACKKLVQRFNSSGAARPGRTGAGVRRAVKDSLDITITGAPAFRDAEIALNEALIPALLRYVRRYPHVVLGPFATPVPDATGKGRLAEAADLVNDELLLTRLTTSVLRPGPINLQRYVADKGGYPRWHSELYPKMDYGESLHRVLLWTLYLNDEFDDGETEFLYQARKIKPRAGSLLIAPSAFTHTHRGNRPRGGDKYIATSWVMFWRAEKLYAPVPPP